MSTWPIIGSEVESNLGQLNQAGVQWTSRVSETLTEAKALIQQSSERGPQSEDGTVHWFSRALELPQGRKRWIVVYTQPAWQTLSR